MMKKHLGIVRNRTDRLSTIKKQAQRKKNRFQMVGKEDFDDYNSQSLTTTNSEPSSCIELTDMIDQNTKESVRLFEEARNKMKKVEVLKKKMGELSKARLTSLRERENQKYDESISKLASQATQLIMAAEGLMRQISKIDVSSSTSKKVLKSMEASLASQIQQASRSLRNQQKQYFTRVKTYEGTINNAIQLTAEQRASMVDQWQMVQQKEEDLHKGKVSQLVSSISKLSAIYKQLNNLVVTQGTVIDRIDYNLDQTEQHTAKAVVHLKGADQHANSAFADKIIKTLAITIILMAIILGFKYMK